MNSSDEYDSENILEENFIDCGVKDMSTLHIKTNITTLNLHYNNITFIKGLQNLSQLRHLDLSSNMISKISGLESLVSLRTLNLSCNRLKKVEGLVRLRQLVRINLSYNEISDLCGFGELGQLNEHPLTVIELCSNQVRLISHVVNNCQKLTNLRQLSLLNNPLCLNTDYRNKILKSLSQLKILDGKDIHGNEIEMNILSDIPGLEQFMEYLSSSTEQYPESQTQKSNKKAPIGRSLSNTPTREHCSFTNDRPVPVTQSEMELKQRLQELEEKLTKFVTEKKETLPVASNYVEEANNRDNNVKLSKFDDSKEKKDKTDLKVAKLMKELDQEKHRRLDIENKLQMVVTRYKELQLQLTNDRRGKDDAMKATEKLGCAFTLERSAKEELERKLMELEDNWNQRHKELLDGKKKLEYAYEDIKSRMEMKEKELVNKSEEVCQNNKALDEMKLKQQVAESSLSSMKKHCLNLEEQVDNLQSTLSRREKEYQMTMANRFSIDSKELQDYVQAQINSVREQGQLENNLAKEKLAECNIRYKSLEDEFRLALHMEADRYDKMEQSYRQIMSEKASLKSKLEIIVKRDIDTKQLIEELTTVVKDQKTKLIELSKNKQEKNKDNKERILTLEAHLEEARKQMIQFELTKQQENKKLQAKQSAQESVIEGLKAERKLWSEELAQQGYLLTQDRSKLECKIEALTSDVSRVKMELEKEVENSKNKSKMIEDQTATILKLKEGLLEKDQEARAFSDKLLDDQKELENRVKYLIQENNQYKDNVSKLTARKDELKNVIMELEERLDESAASQELINQKWKEKSELIAKLESQVVQMKNYWEKKTEELLEERNEAVDKYRGLKSQFDSLEHNYKNQLDMAYKNKDFIEEKADERVAAVENEMRRLLLETDEEKKKLQSRLRILNRAIEDMDQDKK